MTDLTKSILDAAKAANPNFLAEMEEENKKIKNRKVLEVKENFPRLSDDQIIAALDLNKWDVLEAIMFLLTAAETKPSTPVQEPPKEDPKRFLLRMFESLPSDLVQKTLDEQEGDVEAATNKLLEIVEAKEKEKREREATATTLCARFSDTLSKEEVNQVLLKFKWDVQLVATELLRISEERKVERVAAVLKDFHRSTIERTLRKQNWNVKETLSVLIEMRHKQDAEKQQALAKQKEQERIETLKKEEEERKVKEEERIRETKRRALEEEKKKAQEDEKLKQELELELARKAKEAKEAEEAKALKLKKEEELKKKEEEERRKREQEEQVRAQKQREQEDKAAELERLERSQAIFKDITRQVNQVQEQENEALRKGIEALLRSVHDEPSPTSTQEQQQQQQQQQQQRKDDPFPMNAGNTETVLKGVGVRLTATPQEVDCNQTITVSWTVDEPPADSKKYVHSPTTSDWIAMYVKGADFKNYTDWKWLPVASKTGSVQFTAPQTVNEMTFKYYSQKSFNLCAVSNTIHVGPRYEMQINPVTSAPSEKRTHRLVVTQTFGGSYPRAWVGLYAKKTPAKKDSQYVTWQWLSSAAPSLEDPRKVGLQFDIPKAGQWELRLFLDRLPYFGEEISSLAVQTVSFMIKGDDVLIFTVQPELNQITVEYTINSADPKTDSVWVGIFHANQEDNTQHRRCRYLYDQRGKTTFKKLVHAGVYEARLFANRDLTAPLCRSNTLDIQGL